MQKDTRHIDMHAGRMHMAIQYPPPNPLSIGEAKSHDWYAMRRTILTPFYTVEFDTNVTLDNGSV